MSAEASRNLVEESGEESEEERTYRESVRTAQLHMEKIRRDLAVPPSVLRRPAEVERVATQLPAQQGTDTAAAAIAEMIGKTRTRVEAVLATDASLSLKQKMDAQAAARARRAKLERASTRGIPLHQDLLEAVLSGRPEPTRALERLRLAIAWRANHKRESLVRPPLTVVLCGPVDAGKSTALALTVMEWPGTARMVIAQDVARLSEQAWSDRGSIEALDARQLLAIDEVGDEEGDGERLTRLMNRRRDCRKGEGLVTLVATNFEAEEFEALYVDDKLRSRLGEQEAAGFAWCWKLESLGLRNIG